MGQHKRHAVRLISLLKLHRDVYVWREVACVYLKLRAYEALDRPADVQPETQANLVAWDALAKSLVLSVIENLLVGVGLSQYLHDAVDR